MSRKADSHPASESSSDSSSGTFSVPLCDEDRAWLAALADTADMPDGTPYAGLGRAAQAQAAKKLGLSQRVVQIACLESGIIPHCYVRNAQTFSATDQLALLQGRVLLVGLGGLGGTILELLARLGVGRITGADGDAFEESNLNRQLLATQRTVGTPKSQAAQDRAHEVNPAVELTVLDHFLTSDELPGLLRDADVAVDALGGLAMREPLQQAAADANVPLVTAAIAGWSGYVASVPPGAAGPAQFMGSGSAAEDTLGSPAPTVHLAASMQSALVAQWLTNKAPGAVTRLFDLADGHFDSVVL